MTLTFWNMKNITPFPPIFTDAQLEAELHSIQQTSDIFLQPKAQWIETPGTPLFPRTNKVDAAIASFKGPPGLPGHAWAYAIVEDSSGGMDLLIYDCDYRFCRSSQEICKYLHPSYIALIQEFRAWTAVWGKPGSTSKVWVNQDGSYARMGRCVKMSLHWLKSMARYEDRVLEDEEDLRLEWMGLAMVLGEEEVAKEMLPRCCLDAKRYFGSFEGCASRWFCRVDEKGKFGLVRFDDEVVEMERKESDSVEKELVRTDSGVKIDSQEKNNPEVKIEAKRRLYSDVVRGV